MRETVRERPGAGSRRLLALAILAALVTGAGAPAAAGEPAPNRIAWRAWDAATFAAARAEGRVVLVVVSTTWCHWCHVMQRETYADPRVEREIGRGFLAVKEDADARPDLSERFRAYRWPATAFLTPHGEPVLALRGYRSADELLAILADVQARVRRGGPYPGFATPTPPPAAATAPDRAALQALRERLVRQLDGTYDATHQGWGRGQKYPLSEPVAWGLRRARTHPREPQPLRRSLDTLAASEALLDRIWGGQFQYSVGPGWGDPHYEKLVEGNAGALGVFADAYRLTGNARWRADAALVAAWFERFHDAPDGAFYASQDAEVEGREASAFYRLDDAGRRRLGVPRLDRNVYPRENGRAIQAFVAWSEAGGGEPARARAVRAADALLASHADATGLLRHRAAEPNGRRFLADQAEFGRALVALARVTREERFGQAAVRLADAMVRALAAPEGGFYDVDAEPAGLGPSVPRLRSLEGNAAAARFLLGAATLADRPDLRQAALRALSAMDDAAFLQEHWRYVGGLLLAVEEALAQPRRVTVFAAADDPRGDALFAAARPAANADPDLWLLAAPPRAGATAAFAVICGRDGACSDPLTDPISLALALARP